MTHIQKPAMKDCLTISQALHRKFTFLGSDEARRYSILLVEFNFLMLFFRIPGNGLCIIELKIPTNLRTMILL